MLWPIRPLQNGPAKGLFHIHDPVAVGGTYAVQLKDLSVEPEFTAEALKLSFIRARKGRRFKYVLWSTGAFYIFVFASFLMLRRCT